MWRPSCTAAEDRNVEENGQVPSQSRVAAVVYGGRGSQQLHVGEHDDRGTGGGRRVRRPRIATLACPPQRTRGTWWRPSCTAAEDRNESCTFACPDAIVVAAVVYGGRGSQRVPGEQGIRDARVAAVVYGGRGSQPRARRRDGSTDATWRPSCTAAEDRNFGFPRNYDESAEWRPSCTAAEDRNQAVTQLITGTTTVAAVVYGGRGSQPDGTAAQDHPGLVAAVVYGGRGSQPVQQQAQAEGAEWRPSYTAAEDRNQCYLNYEGGTQGWRPSYTAAEDRNFSIAATPSRTRASAAADA